MATAWKVVGPDMRSRFIGVRAPRRAPSPIEYSVGDEVGTRTNGVYAYDRLEDAEKLAARRDVGECRIIELEYDESDVIGIREQLSQAGRRLDPSRALRLRRATVKKIVRRRAA